MTHASDAAVYDLLLILVRSLVDQPELVEVRSLPSEGGAMFRVTVAQSDVGKVIGMSGRTARALRTILSANGAKARRNYTLDISTNEAPEIRRPVS